MDYSKTGLQLTERFEGLKLTAYRDIANAVDAVNGLVTVELNQSQFDSLVDFVFNVGRRAFANSTLLALLNSADYDGAADEFEKWSHAGGRLVAGLLRRRQSEKEQFEA